MGDCGEGWQMIGSFGNHGFAFSTDGYSIK